MVLQHINTVGASAQCFGSLQGPNFSLLPFHTLARCRLGLIQAQKCHASPRKFGHQEHPINDSASFTLSTIEAFAGPVDFAQMDDEAKKGPW